MSGSSFRLMDRADAGRQLAAKLAGLLLHNPVVYALPRGGVPVALEIARALRAPLDLILAKKISAPMAPELALGAVVEGEPPQIVINESVRRATHVDDAYISQARERAILELARRRARYLGDHSRIDPDGRTAIVVDDGIATGATAKAALIALKRRGAVRSILAIPVAPRETLAEMAQDADTILCLHPASFFQGVGYFYDDFHQLSDEETIGLLRQAWSEGLEAPLGQGLPTERREVLIPPVDLAGDLCVPPNPRGIVLFAHGSGSSRLSPRNRAVAETLNGAGFATLLLDLLTAAEAKDRRNVFNIPLLAERLIEATLWIGSEPDISDLALGLFGASTGAGAALLAAAELGDRVSAIVSRGGRPDLAGPRMSEVTAPTLLVVGGADPQVLDLNRQALARLTCEKLLRIVPNATHLFEEPGALEAVTGMASAWFQHYLLPLPGPRPSPNPAQAAGRPLVELLRAAAETLAPLDDPLFAAAFDRFGRARIVLLGESSHGTSEFYRARAAITRRLIERHNFTAVAVEADWPDAAAIDRYVRHSAHRSMSASPFTRFPDWMWRNRDVDDFVGFLREHNRALPAADRVAFYGLDLYSMTASIAAVLAYLDRVDPEAARIARARYSCLSPWSGEPSAYGRASLSEGYALCEAPVTRILIDLLQKEIRYSEQDGQSFFDAMQNARLVANAERYYRAMYYGARESWNLRDRYMFETLQSILTRAGPHGRVVVWAHNSHIGDARYTDMGTERGEVNIGQLCREQYGQGAALIGFGTHSGTVSAASEWDAPMEVKRVLPSRPDSFEALCHETGYERFLIDLQQGDQAALRQGLSQPVLERYIGVIYRPDTERWSHYSYARPADQYDAFVWLDDTHAVTPLPGQVTSGEDETYPFGL